MNEEIEQVINDQERQDKKWREQIQIPLLTLSLICDEFGEMCKEVNKYGFSTDIKRIQDLKDEAINCAACCIAVVESLDRTLLKDLTEEER